jgi:hypothetical protein
VTALCTGVRNAVLSDNCIELITIIVIIIIICLIVLILFILNYALVFLVGWIILNWA